jgi:hypothetical protein
VEAWRGLGEEGDCVFVQAASDAKVFEVGAGESCGFLPPVFWRQVKILGANQISYAAAFVGFVNASPEAIELLLELIGLI